MRCISLKLDRKPEVDPAWICPAIIYKKKKNISQETWEKRVKVFETSTSWIAILWLQKWSDGQLTRLAQRYFWDIIPLWTINLHHTQQLIKKQTWIYDTYKCDVVIVFAFLDWVTWQAFVSSDSKKSSRALAFL